MIPNFMNYVSGIVSIRIKGDMPEKFINLCLAQHILLWNITKIGNDFYAFIRLPDFFCIRPIARKSRTTIKVLSHRGLPFVAKRVKRRKMLLVGAVLCFLALKDRKSVV
jgi:similar to stage IV sporulation protein